MTDKEKAKAFDRIISAIERLKSDLRPTGAFYQEGKYVRGALDLCDKILAFKESMEPNESEDERIRKWLIKTVHLIGVDKDICADQETMDKAIAYLEKQKEQEPITDSVKFEEGFKTGREFERQKQKEQKPEWSEEQLSIIDYLIDLIDEHYKEPCTKGLLANGAQCFLRNLKSLPSRFSYPKKSDSLAKAKEAIDGYIAGLNAREERVRAEYPKWTKGLRLFPKERKLCLIRTTVGSPDGSFIYYVESRASIADHEEFIAISDLERL